MKRRDARLALIRLPIGDDCYAHIAVVPLRLHEGFNCDSLLPFVIGHGTGGARQRGS
jgi:hypothetical protein